MTAVMCSLIYRCVELITSMLPLELHEHSVQLRISCLFHDSNKLCTHFATTEFSNAACIARLTSVAFLTCSCCMLASNIVPRLLPDITIRVWIGDIGKEIRRLSTARANMGNSSWQDGRALVLKVAGSASESGRNHKRKQSDNYCK